MKETHIAKENVAKMEKEKLECVICKKEVPLIRNPNQKKTCSRKCMLIYKKAYNMNYKKALYLLLRNHKKEFNAMRIQLKDKSENR